ncbi:hypothetical protein K461DRAFT_4415 [Myriangium duriaei CBS 260.36]|uniref:Uncharacterized protein n=1 Tax=Myriangium duriaei CBS 260.36 TaxID=1168546 RepID=A0A9P4JDE1_9PEZI|nr:hypothetical protein K461DRAFT_4415 [Myriangium duriaei CBS 260.36]
MPGISQTSSSPLRSANTSALTPLICAAIWPRGRGASLVATTWTIVLTTKGTTMRAMSDASMQADGGAAASAIIRTFSPRLCTAKSSAIAWPSRPSTTLPSRTTFCTTMRHRTRRAVLRANSRPSASTLSSAIKSANALLNRPISTHPHRVAICTELRLPTRCAITLTPCGKLTLQLGLLNTCTYALPSRIDLVPTNGILISPVIDIIRMCATGGLILT